MVAARILLAVALAWAAATALAQTRPPPDARLELEVAPFAEARFAQEMILLTIRGYYGIHINREVLIQPDLPGFSWMQLGHDRWFNIEIAGRQLRGYERRMALFPQRAGRLEIPSFAHHLNYQSRRGERREEDILAEPVVIDVQPHPRIDGWWLPASQVDVTDSWDRPPDQLAPGQTVQRTVTLTAAGAAPEMLPPTPDLETPGLHVFAHAEERRRRLTREGPVSTVTWRWSIRLLRPEAVVMEALSIPWFDTVGRKMREVVLPGYRVAPVVAESTSGGSPWLAWLARNRVGTGLALGFGAGIVLLLWGRRMRLLGEIAEALRGDPTTRARRAIRQAARRGDGTALRQIAYRMALAEPDAALRAPITDAVAPLDRAVFSDASVLRPSDVARAADDLTALLQNRRDQRPGLQWLWYWIKLPQTR